MRTSPDCGGYCAPLTSSDTVYIPTDYLPPNGHNKNLAESSTAAFHTSGRICVLSWGRPYTLELTEHQMEELVWYVIDGAARDDIP